MQDYSIRPPMPPTFFFVVDVTQAAVASGALATVCSAIRGCLDSLAKESLTRVRRRQHATFQMSHLHSKTL